MIFLFKKSFRSNLNQLIEKFISELSNYDQKNSYDLSKNQEKLEPDIQIGKIFIKVFVIWANKLNIYYKRSRKTRYAYAKTWSIVKKTSV